MSKVIRIFEEEVKEKPVNFTHEMVDGEGWCDTNIDPSDYEKTVYLGRCDKDGDLFAAYIDVYIAIFKGHLNSGNY